MAATSGAILKARALGVRFGAVEALKDVSIRMAPGSVHTLIGPNGAGKSSLLNCLSGLYCPWTGAALFEGRDIPASRPPDHPPAPRPSALARHTDPDQSLGGRP